MRVSNVSLLKNIIFLITAYHRKLRRYLDLKSITDPFRVIKGYYEAKRILKQTEYTLF